MIISVNWLKKYTEVDLSIDQLAELIGARLVEIEDAVDLSEKYKDVRIVRVIECEELQDSDHLHVLKIDDNNSVSGVERDEKGYVQVVCGAPNIAKDQIVAWLPPKSVVPSTFGTQDPFLLDARKLRGVVSNGMIASAKELDLYDDHSGILELESSLHPGSLFADAYDLNDTLLDIENKSLTHRPDTFGIIGFAREVAAIQGKKFETPSWLRSKPSHPTSESDASIAVSIDDNELCDRYQAVIIEGIDASKKSDIHTQTWISRVGTKPISLPVDITNYVMLLTGQPLHAFDLDKLKKINDGQIDIHVRRGRGKGDTLKLLDGREIELNTEDIVIANGEKAIALAGAMGGSDTEVDENTKTILLESASFNLYNLRATQMRHGIFSEAITRFTKGQPAELTSPVLTFATSLFVEKGASIASKVTDVYPHQTKNTVIEIEVEFINKTLGTQLDAHDIQSVLNNIECTIEGSSESTLSIIPPYWRTDIHIAEDVVEEIGRILGFDSIATSLPVRTYRAIKPSQFDTLRMRIANTLVRAGANEVLTYSFVHGNLLEKAGQTSEQSYKITNSISPDLQYYRQSLTPSLLQLVAANSKAGFDEFVLFECNKTHSKLHGLSSENVPKEMYMLAGVISRKKELPGSPYYVAKKYLDYLADSLGVTFDYHPMDKKLEYPVTVPFEYRRSALVSDRETGEAIGIVGEYTKRVVRNFKLPSYTAGFEIDPKALEKIVDNRPVNYQPLSRYPGVQRDICFKVQLDISYGALYKVVDNVLAREELLSSLHPVDIYSPSGNETDTKHITLRITLSSYKKTLTSEEVAQVETKIAHEAKAQLNATII